MKTKIIIVKVSKAYHAKLKKKAKEEGRTISGMVLLALKKAFNISS